MFCDSQQCAKKPPSVSCAVYFSVATNICSHAARSLFCLSKNWMFQQDVFALHNRVTKLKKYIFLFGLYNRNIHCLWWSRTLWKRATLFLQRLYLWWVFDLRKQSLRTTNSHLCVCRALFHGGSSLFLTFHSCSVFVTYCTTCQNNNIVVAHWMCIFVHLDMFLQCSSVWPTIVLNTLTSWAPHSTPARLFVTVLIGRLNSGQYSPEPCGSFRNIFRMLHKGKKSPSFTPSPLKSFHSLSAGQRRTNTHTPAEAEGFILNILHAVNKWDGQMHHALADRRILIAGNVYVVLSPSRVSEGGVTADSSSGGRSKGPTRSYWLTIGGGGKTEVSFDHLQFSYNIVSDHKPLPLCTKTIEHVRAQYTCVACQSHRQPVVCIIYQPVGYYL